MIIDGYRAFAGIVEQIQQGLHASALNTVNIPMETNRRFHVSSPPVYAGKRRSDDAAMTATVLSGADVSRPTLNETSVQHDPPITTFAVINIQWQHGLTRLLESN
ncbi:hypothetical protein [Noviherbaspirillum sp. UKPF54]|uniref:hypothetical protein n=1 Tax=Noviherbaspirillum sp. UKPF54 TaxID=2601898 RepID=UPI00143D75F7|nr:hypothetical protein [Noviherbaspirillum sp. UKPF54]